MALLRSATKPARWAAAALRARRALLAWRLARLPCADCRDLPFWLL